MVDIALFGKQGQLRLLRRMLIVGLLQVISLWATALLLPGFDITVRGGAIAATVAVALLNAILRPILLVLTLPLTVVTFGLLTLFINAALLWLASELVDGFQISNFGIAFLGSLVFTVINTFLLAVFNVGETGSFYRELANREAHRQHAFNIGGPDRGMLVLQIDGLSFDVLRFALRTGLMPTLARKVREGSHRVIEWECGLPSQTSASQAGILYGNNTGIPAFRWYEKRTGRMFVSNRPKDAEEIARRASKGTGLLAGAGASLGNIFSGDALHSQLTMSTLRDRPRSRTGDFASYFLNPDNYARSFVLMLREVALEWWQARRQSIRHVEPRVHRGGSYPFLRAITCVFMRDLSVSMALDQMHAGAPVIYVDLLGYDEIAHHAGPERPESLGELSNIDHQISRLESAASEAPIKYEIVVLSDHGQSQGATFRQRYGKSLEQVVQEFAGSSTQVDESSGTTEDWGHFNAVLTETLRAMGKGGHLLGRVVFMHRIQDGAVDVGPDRSAKPEGKGDIVVSASGNLALVNFAKWPERASLEMISEEYPALVESLARHDGIGFVMTRSEEHGAQVHGRDGIRFLEDDSVKGKDPLSAFGGSTATQLKRLDSFPNVGDLVVVSRFDPVTEEVAPFEELVGSHGGAGGPQTRPFLLFPSAWDAPSDKICGAEQIYPVLKGWVMRLSSPSMQNSPVATGKSAESSEGTVGR